LNTKIYTTVIKGFTRIPRRRKALEFLDMKAIG
jgi:hypothetical protein